MQKDTDDLSEFLRFWNICTLKLFVKSCSNWHLITRVLRRAVDHPGVDVDIETGSGMDEEWKAQKTKQKEIVAAQPLPPHHWLLLLLMLLLLLCHFFPRLKKLFICWQECHFWLRSFSLVSEKRWKNFLIQLENSSNWVPLKQNKQKCKFRTTYKEFQEFSLKFRKRWEKNR